MNAIRLHPKMTLADLKAAGEIWYQRTHKLREHYEETGNEKALRLFLTMVPRVLRIGQVIARAKMQPTKARKFQAGGHWVGSVPRH